ncbi:hypothetical protein [Comamonas sp.]|uniref:hypothetical protein n=1 Tax=Comamonas sp. TaxID=34028 RepID=UPI00289771B5|nr:hypothetical protein [Comamonas sp.]
MWDFAISVSLSPVWAMALIGSVRKFAQTGAENNGNSWRLFSLAGFSVALVAAYLLVWLIIKFGLNIFLCGLAGA